MVCNFPKKISLFFRHCTEKGLYKKERKKERKKESEFEENARGSQIRESKGDEGKLRENEQVVRKIYIFSSSFLLWSHKI